MIKKSESEKKEIKKLFKKLKNKTSIKTKEISCENK